MAGQADWKIRYSVTGKLKRVGAFNDKATGEARPYAMVATVETSPFINARHAKLLSGLVEGENYIFEGDLEAQKVGVRFGMCDCIRSTDGKVLAEIVPSVSNPNDPSAKNVPGVTGLGASTPASTGRPAAAAVR